MLSKARDLHTIAKNWTTPAERDAILKEILKEDPMTLDDFVEIGLFPSKPAACRRLKKLGIEPIGYLRGNGRPKRIYFGKKLSAYMLEHEWRVTQILIVYPFPAVRGTEVDPQLRPDATLWIEGEPYHLEMDMGTETTKKVASRMYTYEYSGGAVLVVCQSPGRAESLHQKFKYRSLMFGVFDEILATPFGDVWLGWEDDEEVMLGVNKPVNKS